MPAAQWTMLCPRDRSYPPLPLDGLRSVVTPWPPNSVCTLCGRRPDRGYTGPLHGEQAVFPDRRLVLVCQPCAFASVGLASDVLRGHSCGDLCTDRAHADVVDSDPTVLAMPEPQARSSAIAGRYRGTGWRVLDVSGPSGRSTGSATMVIWLEVEGELEWPDQVDPVFG